MEIDADIVFSEFISSESSAPATLALRRSATTTVLQDIFFGVRQWNPNLNMRAECITSPCAMLEFLIQQIGVTGLLLQHDLSMCLRDLQGTSASNYYHPLDAMHAVTHWSVGIVATLELLSTILHQQYRAFICSMIIFLAMHYDTRGPTWVHLAIDKGLIGALIKARNIWPSGFPEISASLLKKVLSPHLFYYRVCVAVYTQLNKLPDSDLHLLINTDTSWAQLVRITRHRGRYTSIDWLDPISMKNCGWCSESKINSICGACRGVYYCSSECQKSHWSGYDPNKDWLPPTVPHYEQCRAGEHLLPYEDEPFASLFLAPIDANYIRALVGDTIREHWEAIVEVLEVHQPTIPTVEVDLTELVTTVTLTEPNPESVLRLKGEREFGVDIVFPQPGNRGPVLLTAVIIYSEPEQEEEYAPWLEVHLHSLEMGAGVDFDPALGR